MIKIGVAGGPRERGGIELHGRALAVDAVEIESGAGWVGAEEAPRNEDASVALFEGDETALERLERRGQGNGEERTGYEAEQSGGGPPASAKGMHVFWGKKSLTVKLGCR